MRVRRTHVAVNRREWVRRCLEEDARSPRGSGWAVLIMGVVVAQTFWRPFPAAPDSPAPSYAVTISPPPASFAEPDQLAETPPKPDAPPVPDDVVIPDPPLPTDAPPRHAFFAAAPAPLPALPPLRIAGPCAAGTNFLDIMTACPAVAGAEPPSPGGAGYEQVVRDAVSRELRYPLAARRRGAEGLIRLRLTVDADGRVTDVEPLSDRADAQLVKATVDAVRRAAPFPRPGAELAASVSLVLPVRFQLTN